MLVLSPEMADRTCSQCLRFMHDDKPGAMGPRTLRRDAQGRMTLPVFRPFNAATPCHQCPRTQPDMPPGPANGRRSELTEDNLRAILHYRRCRAVNWQTPDAADPLVRRTAAILQGVDDEAARLESARGHVLTEALLTVLAGIRR